MSEIRQPNYEIALFTEFSVLNITYHLHTHNIIATNLNGTRRICVTNDLQLQLPIILLICKYIKRKSEDEMVMKSNCHIKIFHWWVFVVFLIPSWLNKNYVSLKIVDSFHSIKDLLIFIWSVFQVLLLELMNVFYIFFGTGVI